MELNTLKPAPGSKHARRRVGRGIGSGLGKTAGRGHKGQKARSGGFHKVGFEGGQMPLQRRLPKRGFTSMKVVAEVRLSDIESMKADTIDLAALKNEGIAPHLATGAKIILAGELKRRVQVNGVGVTKGAKAAIEAAGGTVAAPAQASEPAPAKADKASAKASTRAKPAAPEKPAAAKPAPAKTKKAD